jgi:LysR family transcriptional regulator, nitrogen assimilation regulatory protein
MNLKTLKYFVAIADAGSFTAAATSLAIAQPALTRQLHELERELGVELLQRLPRGVRLTQAGVVLYESAQKILQEFGRVKQQLAQGQSDTSTPVVLGASPTLARVLLPGLFESCQKSVASMQLRVREAFTPVLLDWLDRGLIDMAIVTNPEARQSLSLHPLLGEPFALVSHHSLKIGPIVSLTQLARIPVLMTSIHRSIVERQLLPLGKKLAIHAEIDSVDSIRELVHRGQWATIMPVSVFKQTQSSNRVMISEVSGVQLNRLLVLATRLGPVENASMPALKQLVEAEFMRLALEGMFSFSAPQNN